MEGEARPRQRPGVARASRCLRLVPRRRQCRAACRRGVSRLGRGKDGAHGARLFLMLFFLVHYGGFCAVHGMFVNVMARGLGEGQDIDVFPRGRELRLYRRATSRGALGEPRRLVRPELHPSGRVQGGETRTPDDCALWSHHHPAPLAHRRGPASDAPRLSNAASLAARGAQDGPGFRTPPEIPPEGPGGPRPASHRPASCVARVPPVVAPSRRGAPGFLPGQPSTLAEEGPLTAAAALDLVWSDSPFAASLPQLEVFQHRFEEVFEDLAGNLEPESVVFEPAPERRRSRCGREAEPRRLSPRGRIASG